MEVDKSIGDWLDDARELHNIAYHFYCQWIKSCQEPEANGKYKILSQKSFIVIGANKPLGYDKFFDNAKILIRKEKINKINENLE